MFRKSCIAFVFSCLVGVICAIAYFSQASLASPNLGESKFPFPSAAHVVTGDSFTCASTSIGDLSCWGSIRSKTGETIVAYGPRPVDTTIQGVHPLEGISIWSNHVCVIPLSEGKVKCWGDNTYGQLGTGNHISSSTPVQVNGLANDIYKVIAGDIFSCGLSSSTNIWQCWGRIPGTALDNLTPIEVSNPEQYLVGSRPAQHNCDITAEYSIQCTGSNTYGQLGDGTFFDTVVPVQVIGFGAGSPIMLTPKQILTDDSLPANPYCFGESNFVTSTDSLLVIYQDCTPKPSFYVYKKNLDRWNLTMKIPAPNTLHYISLSDNRLLASTHENTITIYTILETSWITDTVILEPTTYTSQLISSIGQDSLIIATHRIDGIVVPQQEALIRLYKRSASNVWVEQIGFRKVISGFVQNVAIDYPNIVIGVRKLESSVSYLEILTFEESNQNWLERKILRIPSGSSLLARIGLNQNKIILGNPAYLRTFLKQGNEWVQDITWSDIRIIGSQPQVSINRDRIYHRNFRFNSVDIYQYQSGVWQHIGRTQPGHSSNTFTQGALNNQYLFAHDPIYNGRGGVVIYDLSNPPPTYTPTPSRTPLPTSTPTPLPNTPTPTATPITCNANLLNNPGFEGGLNNWNKWDNNSASTNDANSGASALQITGSGGMGQHRAMSAGQSVLLKAFGKVSNSGGAQVGINFYDANWNVLSRKAIGITSQTYAPHQLQATAPANTSLVEVWVWNSANGGGTGSLMVDDFCLTTNTSAPTATPTASATPSLTPTPTHTPAPGTPTATPRPSNTPTLTPTAAAVCADNLIPNPGFEAGYTNWDKWDNNSAIVTQAHSGANALRIGEAAGGIGFHTIAQAGQHYAFSGWSQVISKTNGASVGISFFDANWRLLGTNTTAQISSSQYQPYSLQATAPDDSAWVIAWAYKTADGYQYLDDTCLTISAIAPTTTRQSTPSAAARMVAPGRWVTTAASTSRAVYLPLALRK